LQFSQNGLKSGTKTIDIWENPVFAQMSNGTSQTCPQCGAHTGKKELSERVHYCAECGYITDRDVAAAQVVEQRGLVAVGQKVIAAQRGLGGSRRERLSQELPVEEGCPSTPMKQETSRAILGSPRSTRFG
jgi:putative transposase